MLRCIDESEVRGHPESGVDRTSYVKYNAPLSPYTRLLKLKAQVDKSLGAEPKKHFKIPQKGMPLPSGNVDNSERGFLFKFNSTSGCTYR